MSQPEAWLRGPEPGIIAELQPVAHTLTGVAEELRSMVGDLPPQHLWTPVAGGWSIGQHVHHLAGSTQRLLAYAMGRALTEEEIAIARAERDIPLSPASTAELLRGVEVSFQQVRRTLESLTVDALMQPRGVGRARLPSSVGGLLFHIAEHAQRHAGQVAILVRVVGTTVSS